MIRTIAFYFLFGVFVSGQDVDHNGYVAYCPCKGRFGSQVDQVIAALAFAKRLNRTLILPPFMHYDLSAEHFLNFQPFDHVYDVERLEKFHRAVTFNDFQVFLSGEVWTLGTRVAFCASAQPGGKPNDCNAKHGMQAADFWNYFGVDFERSEFYSPLSLWPPSDPNTQTQNQNQTSSLTSDSANASALSALDSWALEWRKRFPSRKYPVIALAEPLVVRREDLWMHRYLQWSPEHDEKVATIAHNYFRVPFLAIHLRNHASHRDACTRIRSEKLTQLGASYQCLGAEGEHGLLTYELCYQSHGAVRAHLERFIDAHRAALPASVYISTDNDSMQFFVKHIFEEVHVEVVRPFLGLTPQLELAILGRADFAILNCVSGFSAVAARERHVRRLPTEFWAFGRDPFADNHFRAGQRDARWPDFTFSELQEHELWHRRRGREEL